jgi:hypothetical protein
MRFDDALFYSACVAYCCAIASTLVALFCYVLSLIA